MVATVVAVLVLLAWVQHSGYRTALDLRDAWLRQRALQQEVARLQRENLELETSIEALEHNGRAVEEIARNKLGLAREGEIVIRIPEKR